MFQVVRREFSGANLPRTIRFTDTLYEELKEVSAENGISFNLLVLQCCRYALDRQVGQGEPAHGERAEKEEARASACGRGAVPRK